MEPLYSDVAQLMLLLSDFHLALQEGRRLVSVGNLQLHQGEWVHLTGESGSGKSSLLKVLAGLISCATRLVCGATTAEALRPVYREALQASLAPTLAAVATTGLVALPGMMTGQLLGGAPPFTAIRYQVAIMIAITTSVSLAAVLNLIAARRLFLDDFDMPHFE